MPFGQLFVFLTVTMKFGHGVTFISQPRNVSVFEGDCAQFNCSFTGSGEVPLWSINNSYHDWMNIPRIYTFSLYDFSLKIQNVSLEMDGTPFQCAVEGFTSQKGVLFVKKNTLVMTTDTLATEFQGEKNDSSNETNEEDNYYQNLMTTLMDVQNRATSPTPGLIVIISAVLTPFTVLMTITLFVTVLICVMKSSKKPTDHDLYQEDNYDMTRNQLYEKVCRNSGSQNNVMKYNMTQNQLYGNVNKITGSDNDELR